MVLVFGSFAIIDGIATIWSAFTEPGMTNKWPTVLLGGGIVIFGLAPNGSRADDRSCGSPAVP
jgi:hypothetical protein